MLDLTDFNSSGTVNLSDFAGVSAKTRVFNRASVKNISAAAAMASPSGDTLEAYNSMMAEDEQGSTVTRDSIVSQATSVKRDKDMDYLRSVMEDSSIDIQTREALVDEFLNNQSEFSLFDYLGEENSIQDSSAFETAEEEYSRINVGEAIAEINDYRSQVQKIINREELKSSPEFVENAKDFLEIMVPFVEQGAFAKLVAEISEGNPEAVGEAFAFLGRGKADIRDWFRAMPAEERLKLIPKIIAMVEGSDAVILQDTNDLMRMDFLRTVIDEGYYGDLETVIDNVVSILDLVGLGAAAKSGVRSIRASRAVARAEKDLVLKSTLEAFDPSNAQEFMDLRKVDPIEVEVPVDPERAAAARRPTADPSKARTPGEQKILERKLRKQQKNFERDVRIKKVRANVPEFTVAKVMKDANPQKARVIHAIASVDESGEAASALYGASRMEALADDIMPEVGYMRAKLSEPDALVEQIRGLGTSTNTLSDVRRYTRDEQGAIYYAEKERKAARAKVFHDFQNVKNLTSRKEMFVWGERSDGAVVKAVYGPQDGGFSNAETARDLARLALREYGIDEENLKILSRDGDRYEVVDAPVESLPEGDYLVQVDYTYKIRPNDIEDWSRLDVKNNWFDKSPYTRGKTSGAGTIQSHLLDPQSMLHPIITGSASAQVAKSAKLIKMLGSVTEELGERFSKLPQDRRDVLTNLWKEANFKGFKIDDVVGTNYGLSKEEMEISDLWRQVWDVEWELENKIRRNEMASQGYMVYKSPKNNTVLFAKPRDEGAMRAKSSTRVYDPENDKFVIMEKKEINSFLDNGGQFARLKDSFETGSGPARTILVRNSPGAGYIRAFNDNDKVLNYREGYFHLHYNAPYFITRKMRNDEGKFFEKTIATARNKSEAETYMKRYSQSKRIPMDDLGWKFDEKASTVFGDDSWASDVAAGRSSQKVRGITLEDSSGAAPIESAYIMDPDEALAQSIRSISNRVELGDWLEVNKRRFMETFKDALPTDSRGRAIYPRDANEIGAKGGVDADLVADAATTWEYIRAMENGYYNHVDALARTALIQVSDAFAGRNNPITDWVDEAARRAGTSRVGLTGATKKLNFVEHLVLNPLRQIVVQAHQMVQIAGIEPKYFLTKLMPEATVLSLMEAYFAGGKKVSINALMDLKFEKALKDAGMTAAEAVQMYNQFERSGLKYYVDTHNLLRDNFTFAQTASTSLGKKLSRKVDSATSVVQKVGFDAGERANIKAAWLTFRHRAKVNGKDLSNANVLDEITADATNFTYNMNRSGEMPYNSNALGLAAQFLQVPHKAFTQIAFNRTLTKAERIRLGVWNSLVYGLPGIWVAQNYFGDILPENAEMREVITRGLEHVLINYTMSTLTGDDVNVDWSSLAPWDAQGMMETIQAVFTGNFGEAIRTSPTGSTADRVGTAISTAARFFGVVEDYEDPTTIGGVAKTFAELIPGLSNTTKAAYALQTGKTLNKYGDEAYATSTTEAILRVFGFKTMEETAAFDVGMKISEHKKAIEGDVRTWYKEYKRHMAVEGKPVEYYLDTAKLFNEFFRAHPDMKTRRFIYKELEKLIAMDVQNNDFTFHRRVMTASEFMDMGQLLDIVRQAPYEDENKREEMIRAIQIIRDEQERVNNGG